MSKQAQLPPRCPLLKKSTPLMANGFVSPPSCKDINSFSGEQRVKCFSEEQPTWLNDLLSDSDSNPNGILHRRAASDSLALFDGVLPLKRLDQLKDPEAPNCCEPDNEVESSGAYGPNSPRTKNKLDFPKSKIVSAFSEYVIKSPLQHLDGHITVSGIPQLDSFGDDHASASVTNAETKAMKRHPGQRSRARKLQYIAELERTVNILQNLGSELSVRVATMLHQQVALSMENNSLKQQLLKMQQEKFLVDGEYLSLKKDLERLKKGMALSSTRKSHNWSNSGASVVRPDAVWEMLDMRKLDLN